MIPYARQCIDEDDIAAVVSAMRSDYLTTGPAVAAFEAALAARCGAAHAVVVSSGTAALHCAYAACGLTAGDEIITSPLTFSATANMALALGATPRFCDIDADTLCLDVAKLQLNARTKLLVPVDFGGAVADIDACMQVAKTHGLKVVEDASHSLGARVGARAVGSIADATVLSFHPVKTITSAEGGAVLTQDAAIAQCVRDFRNHGLVRERARLQRDDGPWYYEVQSLGFNYRLSDLHCALGASQLHKLDAFVARRAAIVARYDEAFWGRVRRQRVRAGTTPAWHLYAVRVRERARFVEALRVRGIATQVHYVPVNAMPLYGAAAFAGLGAELTPQAQAAYAQLVSLPLFPALTDAEVEQVIAAVRAELD